MDDARSARIHGRLMLRFPESQAEEAFRADLAARRSITDTNMNMLGMFSAAGSCCFSCSGVAGESGTARASLQVGFAPQLSPWRTQTLLP